MGGVTWSQAGGEAGWEVGSSPASTVPRRDENQERVRAGMEKPGPQGCLIVIGPKGGHALRVQQGSDSALHCWWSPNGISEAQDTSLGAKDCNSHKLMSEV